MQFDVVANVTATIMAHPPLFWSAVCFSYIHQPLRFLRADNPGARKIIMTGFLLLGT
jgi:hypothetical protein